MTAVPPWDAFTAAEAEVRAMVADPRWAGLSLPDRAHVLAARILVTPDGDRWLYGRHARWHLLDPADGRWRPRKRPISAVCWPSERWYLVKAPRSPRLATET
ncbi:hypothetical protein ACWEPC_24275, partial [Nonomuraea sp. NPDC004297]